MTQESTFFILESTQYFIIALSISSFRICFSGSHKYANTLTPRHSKIKLEVKMKLNLEQ